MHDPAKVSPPIDHISWGRIEIGARIFKDVKLFPGGARAWDWSETGTRHIPGIQPADALELVEHGATHVVLSRGMHEVMQVPRETVEALEARGVTVHVLQTEEAARLYAELRGTRAVGALLHSTC